MSKSYRLEKVTFNEKMDALVGASDDGSIFMTSDYLRYTGCRLGLYHCYRAQELRAVVVLVESADGVSAILDDLVIYGGLCFGRPTNGQGLAQRNSERHEISVFIAAELTDRYESIEFALAPSVVDIRPFQWYRYGEKIGRY